MTPNPFRTALAPDQRVCVIGAGCSGLTTAKALTARGVPFDCYEKGSALGGNWRYDNDNGQSAAYHSLHINSSKGNTQFADFPMPADFPDYGHRSDVLRYLEAYADHFGVTPRVRFRTEVLRVIPAHATPDMPGADTPGAAGWDVTVRDADGREATQRYGAVAVCNGHHWDARLPDFPGRFDGEAMHAHDYRRPDSFADKRVLVVGIGNSAVDIAVEVSRVAAHVSLSTRSSAWIVPKYLLGRPADQWTIRASERLPLWMRERIFRTLIYLSTGDQSRYGLPKPTHGLLAAHPTLSQELLSYIGHGRVTVRPDVAELAGRHVVFADGARAEFDAIIYATGYRITFPFFSREDAVLRDARVALYRRVLDPEAPGLYFVGLVQPIGSLFPIAELQARWVAALVAGDCVPPAADAMRRTIAADDVAVASRYRASPRHTIQVDFWTYAGQLGREMRRGAPAGA